MYLQVTTVKNGRVTCSEIGSESFVDKIFFEFGVRDNTICEVTNQKKEGQQNPKLMKPHPIQLAFTSLFKVRKF